ncbi:hypothetical protein C8R46DRAFT_1210818 [Mycena filopes]|nr:hypothetical protein C8R46DRAFT_1210818 [Mycena filopes]
MPFLVGFSLMISLWQDPVQLAPLGMRSAPTPPDEPSQPPSEQAADSTRVCSPEDPDGGEVPHTEGPQQARGARTEGYGAFLDDPGETTLFERSRSRRRAFWRARAATKTPQAARKHVPMPSVRA